MALARDGRRVLIVSLDPAHSLSDVLDRPIGVRGRAVAGEVRITDRLDALEIDTLALLEERYRGLVALLALGGTHDHGAQFADLAPEELTGMPGIEDLLGLGEVARLAARSRWDVIVVDCPPTAEALRMLAVPETVAGYVERVWPQHRRVAAATSPDTRLALIVALIDRLVDATAAVTTLLSDWSRTALRVVTTAERVALAETRRVLSAAALAGLRVDAIIVNKLLPEVDSQSGVAFMMAWYEGCRAAQQDVLSAVEAVAGDVPILTADRADAEPIGWDALDVLARSVFRGVADAGAMLVDGSRPIRVTLESGSGVDSVYEMRMHLPLTDPGTLTLGRVEDDLVVGADGKRRRIRLASVLRRCTVRDADFDGADLVVRFVPDPAVWPQ
ncbi:ArsA family ATPase [Rhodococcus sp. ABRD24]|uniref:ArsA family ATPase n=1 Tax=Rhodococcus sp. ABRD24 TaxID=2507582 RepID=UPI001F60908A|nr:ArsA family ATPase [Rhodococcus sp. ABRD24]